MTDVTSIAVDLVTGRGSGASSDGSVYLGLGGREFRLARSDIDDYQGGADKYILGEGSNKIENAETSDPRQQYIEVESLRRLPVYIRFAPYRGSVDDNW